MHMQRGGRSTVDRATLRTTVPVLCRWNLRDLINSFLTRDGPADSSSQDQFLAVRKIYLPCFADHTLVYEFYADIDERNVYSTTIAEVYENCHS